MMSRKQKKQYIALENSLAQKFDSTGENELVLSHEDFKDGKLKSSAFSRLKNECWYIPYEEEPVIKLPKEYEGEFKNSLEFMASRELSKVKKDRREARIQAIILFAIGIVILGALALCLRLIDSLSDIMFVTELATIVSWVFVWAAVTKFFIDRKEAMDLRFTLLQLLSAKIILIENT